jgi:hypothetical protein
VEQLVYISTSRAMPRVPQLEIDAILEVSRCNNARDGLTGLLVVGGRRFLQVLEGPEAALTVAYDRIQADPRHFALVQLSRRTIEERSFPDWQMGFERSGAGLGAQIDGLLDTVADPVLRAEFRGFADRHASAA